MGLLNRNTSVTVILNQPWFDPELDAATFRLKSLPPDQAPDFVLHHLRGIRHQPERHVQALDVLTEAFESNPDVVRERVGRLHLDDRDTASDLLAMLGSTLVCRAWEIRGSGSASSVDPNAWGHFHTVLEEAEYAFGEALKLVPNHPAAAVGLLATGLGLKVPMDEFWNRFNRARQVSATLYAAHSVMLSILCEKWYGSHEAMFRFGREVAAAAPAGDPVSAMLPMAHAEYLCRLNMLAPPGTEFGELLSDPGGRAARAADLPAVVEASRRWLGGDDGTAPPHPKAVQAHQIFAAYFLWMEDKDRVRSHLRQCGGRVSHVPFGLFTGETDQVFAQMHEYAGLKLPKAPRR